MDRSRHTITKYLGDEKTHKAINEKFFKRLNVVKKDLYEVEFLKSTIEHREPIIVGFFIFQYAKLRMLELYYNFFHKYCDENKFEELEMDTDSLYLALAEENLDDCILPEKKAHWTLIRRNDCRDDFIADAIIIFLHVHAALFTKSMTNENLDYLKKNFAALKCCACAARHIAAMIVRATFLNLAAKDSTKER